MLAISSIGRDGKDNGSSLISQLEISTNPETEEYNSNIIGPSLLTTVAKVQCERNILTNVNFPCPTLLRKSKSINALESLYSEVCPNPRKVLLNSSSGSSAIESSISSDDEDQISCNGRSNSICSLNLREMSATMVDEQLNKTKSKEKNNGAYKLATIGKRGEHNSDSFNSELDGCGSGTLASTSSTSRDLIVYINMEEVEAERKRLLEAQRVRAKYAESWIDGQVVDDSIIGDNKQKTKAYWESRMRIDSYQKEQQLNDLNKLQKQENGKKRNSSSTGTVLDKIAAEIEELHQREKELTERSNNRKNSGVNGQISSSSASEIEEEEDVFSSNESSVGVNDDFDEHSESPRFLESGFYSNTGEEDGSSGANTATSGTDAAVNTGNTKILVEAQLHHSASAHSEKKRPSVHLHQQQELAIDTVDEVEGTEVPSSINKRPYIVLTKETPIEKEIRIAREREEEYRIQRLNSVGPLSPPPVSVEIPTSPTTDSFRMPSLTQTVKTLVGVGIDEKTRSIQYQLATERLKKEILEAEQREEELRKIHRKVSSQSSVVVQTQKGTGVAKNNLVNGHRASTIEKPQLATASVTQSKVTMLVKEDLLDQKASAHKSTASTTVVQSPKKFGSELDISKPKSFPAPLKELDASPVSVTPKISEPEETVKVKHTETVFTEKKEGPLKRTVSTSSIINPIIIGRPGLNSFNSIQRYLLKSSVQLRIAKNFQLPTPKTETEEIKQVPSNDASKDDNENTVEAPRRKYIPATTKIQKELKEMKEREKELQLIRTRSFKSTPDLSQIDHDSLDQDQVDHTKEKLTKSQMKPVEFTSETPVYEVRARKRSTLINQWEKIIHGEN